jgi:chitinase
MGLLTALAAGTLVTAVLVTIYVAGHQGHAQSPVAARQVAQTWFAPYVDVTSTPDYEFQAGYLNPARHVVLGFVDADPRSPCQPSWGGVYSPALAAQALDLDRRIRQFQDGGGDVIVSFGGADGAELADSCHDLHLLESAYSLVISRYGVDTIDIDLEGASLGDSAATALRSRALAAVQREVAARHGKLSIWLTLPAEPAGMEANALSIVRSALAAGIRLAGVNVLAEDFGTSSDPSAEMGLAVEDALAAAHAQLQVTFKRAGVKLTSIEAWAKLGATVMIGANDITGETLTLGDASVLAAYASRKGLGRLSMWSLNRDAPCRRGTPSSDCSGVSARSLSFAAVFARLRGGSGGVAQSTVPPRPDQGSALPYPRWRHGETYQAGYKVVLDGYVYQAKWFSGKAAPGVTVAHPWLTPWLLLGPVLPSDRTPTLTTLPPGTFPNWSRTTVYKKGDRVLYRGLPYVAAYWTKGAVPDPEPLDVSAAPWRPLFTLPGEPPVN